MIISDRDLIVMIKRIITLHISIIAFLYDTIRSIFLTLIGKKPAGRCVILYYHDIHKAQQQRFSHQMDLLLNLSEPISCSVSPTCHEGNRYTGITFDDGFLSFKEVVLPELERKKIPAAVFIPTQFLGNEPGWLTDASERHMNPNEIREIAKSSLVTIGSHGVSHKPFTGLMVHEAKQELIESKGVIEEILGQKITLFSFPHGAYSEIHLQLAREIGYARTFSIQPYCAFESNDEFITGRVKVDPFDWSLEFSLKVAGAYRWLPYAYHLKRILFTALTNRNCRKGLVKIEHTR